MHAIKHPTGCHLARMDPWQFSSGNFYTCYGGYVYDWVVGVAIFMVNFFQKK